MLPPLKINYGGTRINEKILKNCEISSALGAKNLCPLKPSFLNDSMGLYVKSFQRSKINFYCIFGHVFWKMSKNFLKWSLWSRFLGASPSMKFYAAPSATRPILSLKQHYKSNLAISNNSFHNFDIFDFFSYKNDQFSDSYLKFGPKNNPKSTFHCIFAHVYRKMIELLGPPWKL